MSDLAPVDGPEPFPTLQRTFDRRRAGRTIGSLARPVALVDADATGAQVRELFQVGDCNTVVVVDRQGRPLGTLARQSFFAALAGPNAYALWARRPVLRLAAMPRTVAMDDSFLTATALVSQRDRDHLGDDVIVVDSAMRVVGSVAVHDVLRAMVEDQLVLAKQANPLTGLPGNAAIDNELRARLAVGPVFAVTYLDLDRFKLVNDHVGFAVGDQLIVALATATTAAARPTAGFVGHIGGDDFLLVADKDAVEPLVADAVSRFHRRCSEIATEHTTTQQIITEVSVSAASVLVDPTVVTSPAAIASRLAPVKHEAKQITGTSHVLASVTGCHERLRLSPSDRPTPSTRRRLSPSPRSGAPSPGGA